MPVLPLPDHATLRFGLIGAGRIGRMHAELLVRRVPGACLRAVCDVNLEAARVVAARAGADVAESTASMLARDDIDAVAICSSTPMHVEHIIAAAAAGKAIFCEKPISLDLAEVNRAVAAVDRAGVPLHVGFNRRFDPSHQAVAQVVAGGEIGAPHLARITSRDPAPPPIDYLRSSGGLFFDLTIHDFDMARYAVGAEVATVQALGAVRVDPRIGEAGDIDTALVTLVHAGGCLTVIDNSRGSVYGYDQRVEVFGAGGMAISENPLRETTRVFTASGERRSSLFEYFLQRYVSSYERQWIAFVEAVREGGQAPVGADDARAALVIALAAERSLREGRTVGVTEVSSPAAEISR